MCAREKSFTDLKDMETQSHPRIEEAWGPNTLASHNPKPKQTKQLSTSLPPFAVLLGSLPGQRAFFLLGQALELRHAQPLWKGYRKSKESCYHAIGVPQGSSPAAKPFGLTVLLAPTKLYQYQRAASQAYPLPRAPPPSLAQSRSFYLIQFLRVNHRVFSGLSEQAGGLRFSHLIHFCPGQAPVTAEADRRRRVRRDGGRKGAWEGTRS